jgi:hypothetical protein
VGVPDVLCLLDVYSVYLLLGQANGTQQLRASLVSRGARFYVEVFVVYYHDYTPNDYGSTSL